MTSPPPSASPAPVTVAVTGAAGQIGYAALFRIAAGAMLGRHTPVALRLLELPGAVRAAEGVVMELDDGAFPLLAGTEIYDDPVRGFDGVDVALLIGSRPRTKGMERADLLEPNAQIFATAGKAPSTPVPVPMSGCWSSETRPTPTLWWPQRTPPTSPVTGSRR